MKHLVSLEELYRRQQLPAEAGSGTWEERVAAMERMKEAMEKSGWPRGDLFRKPLSPQAANASSPKSRFQG